MHIGRSYSRSSFPLPILLLVALMASALIQGTTAQSSATKSDEIDFGLTKVAEGFDRPVQVVDAGDGSGRLFVVEQSGRVRIIRDGQIVPEPFLDLRDLVSCCGERGLLSVAFHPDFANNGFAFVDYTDTDGDTVVARYSVAADQPDRADPARATVILTVDQPAANHNGGLLLFGPKDGCLYIGLGDGGGGNGRNGQDLSTLLGKILRIDVDHTTGELAYAIPPDNPFVDQPGVRPEIWALGLRNPRRFSFDRDTGDLWIGDVGSATYEEVNFHPAASAGGENYGWHLMEGASCRGPDGCDRFAAPVSGFDRSEGCVVTGGYVYRGNALPTLQGVYLFADYCSSRVWGLVPDANTGWVRMDPIETGLRITSFGEDQTGELYLVDMEGSIYKIVANNTLGRAVIQLGSTSAQERGTDPNWSGDWLWSCFGISAQGNNGIGLRRALRLSVCN